MSIQSPVEWQGPWEIGWPKDDFNRVKDDPRFLALLTIARLRNMLRFAQGLIVFPPTELPPSAGQRHTLNTFFLTNSLLVEAERVVNGTGAQFRDYAHYRLLAEAVHAPKFRDLVDRVRQVRHWSVFHFFTEAAEQAVTLGYFADPPDFVPFLTGESIRDFDISASLADQVPIELMIREPERANLEEAFKTWLDEASESTTALLRALDEFLAGMATEFGAVHRPKSETESKET